MESSTVHLVSDAVQIQERLILNLSHSSAIDDKQSTKWSASKNSSVIEDCKQIRDKLRDIKSHAEGSAVDFETIGISDVSSAKKLRQLLLQHSSLTPDLRQTYLDLLDVIFSGYWKRLLFAAIVSCPWYMSTQSDCCQQAKHNTIFLVYVNKDSQCFAPVDQHVKERDGDVFEHEGWLYAAEVFHFVRYISKGKVRFVETLFLPETCVVYSDEHWLQLVKLATNVRICGLSGFLEQCRGQAVGAVGRKRKKNGMVLRDEAKIYDFCESFRLLQHTSCILSGANITVLSVTDTLPLATKALNVLKEAYHNETTLDGGSASFKDSLFELVMRWRSDIDDRVNSFQFTDVDVVKSALRGWIQQVRLHNTERRPSLLAPMEERKRAALESLLGQIGGSVSKLSPQQIILIARAGSHLYGLAKSDSDTDYVVIYADSLEEVVSRVDRVSESTESRGVNKTMEYGAYEARLLTEMLWKGSIVMLELVFAEDLDYCSEAWTFLMSNKDLFVTEQSILQYYGLIKNNLVAIKSEKHKRTQRELKLFYQIFHKLHCLEFLLRRQCPQIKCEGETRDFILSIRNSNLQDFDRDLMYQKALDRFDSLKQAFADRKNRLPENINYEFLLNWLMSIRGIK